MSDEEVFRQTRKKISKEEVDATDENPLNKVQQIQEAVAKETGKEVAKPFTEQQAPFEMSGNMPPEFRAALQGKQGNPQQEAVDEDGFQSFEAPPDRPRKKPKRKSSESKIRVQGSDDLEALLGKLAERHQWETFELPSKGKFYNNVPEKIHIRAMTGEEEQILATPRWVKRGKAIDMIFQKCIQETFDTEQLLSADRTHLLIYLRGISYTPEYDVEIKCPNCSMKFSTVIDLNSLDVEACPDDFSDDDLCGVLPASGFEFSYRLPTGSDEQEISQYRERRISTWGDQGDDDTLLYRTALLLEDIEGVTMKKELAHLLKKLPIQDVAYLRNEINDPPFGVDTEVPMICPSCSEEFEIDLPLETNFFFPRKREERVPA